MNYTKFNKWVFDYYRTINARDEICCLAIDVYEIEHFKNQFSLKDLHFEEIKSFQWSKLLQKDRYDSVEVPRYFGLIALQCLAATTMENSGEMSSKNYNSRLCDIIGIEQYSLGKAYAEDHGGTKIQDYIWQDLKMFLAENFGFRLNIPNVKTGKDRYIQYPKEQVVLNKEDLKEIGQKVFGKIIFEEEMFPEIKFERIFLAEFSKQKFSRKNNTSHHLGFFQDIFLKQVFNYFNSKDWQRENTSTHVSYNRKQKINYVIELDLEGNIIFYEGMKEILDPYEVFKREDICFFQKVAGTEEYEKSNTFLLNEEIIIVSRYPLNFGECLNHDYFGLNIVKSYFSSRNDIPQKILKSLRDEDEEKVVVLDGIRLGHARQYVVNLGPEIIVKCIEYQVLYSSYQSPLDTIILDDYKPKNCPPGIYRIRVSGFTNLEFRIVESKAVLIDGEQDFGLDLTNFHLVEEGDLLRGLSISKGLKEYNKSSVNEWIRSNMGMRTASKNKLLKTISYLQNDRK